MKPQTTKCAEDGAKGDSKAKDARRPKDLTYTRVAASSPARSNRSTHSDDGEVQRHKTVASKSDGKTAFSMDDEIGKLSRPNSRPSTPRGSKENLSRGKARTTDGARVQDRSESRGTSTRTRPTSRTATISKNSGMKKASSTHSISGGSETNSSRIAAGTPRAANTARFRVPTGPAPRRSYGRSAAAAAAVSGGSVSNGMRRAASSNAVNNDRVNSSKERSLFKVPQRMSAQSEVLVYNAELLANFEKEKERKDERISELQQVAETRLGELEKCKYEVKRLQEDLSKSQEETEHWRAQCSLLRLQMLEMGMTPVGDHETDSEKLAALNQTPANTEHVDSQSVARSISPSRITDFSSTAPQPASRHAASSDHDGASMEMSLERGAASTPCSIDRMDSPHLDRMTSRSSDGLDQISVACLQDKIQRMEEHTYSQSEELQATLQELGDLQSTVNELCYENEKLGDERELLLESLCSQTEKLESTRMQVDRLKALLLSDPNESNKSERELQLTELLSSAQVEKEELVLRQVELANNVRALDARLMETLDEVQALSDKSSILEEQSTKLTTEKRDAEREVEELQQINSSAQMELQRLRNMLEVEKSKLASLEQRQSAVQRSEIESLLDQIRKEHSEAEAQLADYKGKLQREQVANEHLRSLVQNVRTENESRDARWRSSESEHQLMLERKQQELCELEEQLRCVRAESMRLEQQCLETERVHSSQTSQLQHQLTDALHDLDEARRRHTQEKEDWHQFQTDLQTAVVVANSFRSDVQKNLELLEEENASLREKLATAEFNRQKLEEDAAGVRLELASLRQQKSSPSRTGAALLETLDARGRVRSAVGRELSMIRNSGSRSNNQNVSVKHLIQSIEQQVKVGSSGGNTEPASTLSGSMESLKSTASESHQLRRRSTGVDRPRQVTHRHTVTGIIYDPNTSGRQTPEAKAAAAAALTSPKSELEATTPERKISTGFSPISILSNGPSPRRPATLSETEKKGVVDLSRDPLSSLVKAQGGSKRNALLKWVQHKTQNYPGIDVTNFSSSWNDGLAFCALIHNYLPNLVPYRELLNASDKKRNFTVAFEATESVGIPSLLNMSDMLAMERPDWQAVMTYVTSIYKHFELGDKS